MEELIKMRRKWLERVEELKAKADKEPNELKAKDMEGSSKGYADCANQLKNYLIKQGVELF